MILRSGAPIGESVLWRVYFSIGRSSRRDHRSYIIANAPKNRLFSGIPRIRLVCVDEHS